MASISIFQEVKELEMQINSIVSFFDMADLPMAQQNLVGALKHQLIDARLDARDYEYAETRAEQLQVATEAGQRVEALQQNILEASTYNIFSAVDVAQLSARLQHIMSRMN
jgi:hypothetical protein